MTAGAGASGPRRVAAVLYARPATEDARLALHTELLAAAATARHPCTATVHDVAVTPEGHGQLLLDWFPEGSFAAAEPLPLDDVLIAGIRAALSLRAAHQRGVLHLDVRPRSAAARRGRRGLPVRARHRTGGVSRSTWSGRPP